MVYTRIHWTWLERLGRNKRSSLLQKVVNYGRKKFYNIGPCSTKRLTDVSAFLSVEVVEGQREKVDVVAELAETGAGNGRRVLGGHVIKLF